jgi:ABC-type nitrate/sulfonate/bicarbonate transport system ATPase subunit
MNFFKDQPNTILRRVSELNNSFKQQTGAVSQTDIIPERPRGKIEIGHLRKQYGNSLLVFDGISFDVQPGKIISIVGPSGSGKSTLLHLITGLDKGFSGTITIDGIPSDDYLRTQRIAFVPQKYSNFRWLNVRDNIATAFLNKRSSKSEQDSIINSLLAEFELSQFGQYYIHQLSGGMQQRVAVARALAQDTDIIALDEPFGALDMKIRENLQLLFKEVNFHHQKTVLFVTHDIEEAIFLSDTIIVFSKLPIEKLQVFDEKIARFKGERNPAIKYDKAFTNLRRQIEEYILNA